MEENIRIGSIFPDSTPTGLTIMKWINSSESTFIELEMRLVGGIYQICICENMVPTFFSGTRDYLFEKTNAPLETFFYIVDEI